MNLATTTFIARRENIILLGPSGPDDPPGRRIRIKAAEAARPVAFDLATG